MIVAIMTGWKRGNFIAAFRKVSVLFRPATQCPETERAALLVIQLQHWELVTHLPIKSVSFLLRP
jgi:hypothetical protein